MNEIPDEAGLNTWYPWSATGDTTASVLGLESWNAGAAGQFGRISRRGSELIYNQKPIKLWGLNLSFGATAPEKQLADKRAAFYRKYGINAVRLHKWADGSGWAGILGPDSAVEFDAAALDRFDYQVAKLKEAGIFVKLSATFGSLKLGTKDKAMVPWIEEFGPFRDGRIETPHSAIHYSPELQAVQIAQVANMLKHRNPYTNLTYAKIQQSRLSKSSTSRAFCFTARWIRSRKAPRCVDRSASVSAIGCALNTRINAVSMPHGAKAA
jgi:hypothetical protein